MDTKQILSIVAFSIGVIVLFTFAGGIFSDESTLNDEPPEIEFTESYDDAELTLTHESGDEFNTEQVKVLVNGEDGELQTKQDTLSEGDEIIVSADPGELVQLIWVSSDGTQIETIHQMQTQPRELTENAPNVTFEYSGEAGEEYEVTHSGGDDFNPENVMVNGTEWNSESDRVRTGDSTTVSTEVESGEEIRVVWMASDGGSSATIGTYTIP